MMMICTATPGTLFCSFAFQTLRPLGIQDGVEDEASEEERHSKRSSDSLIFLDGLRMMYGGGRSGRGHLGWQGPSWSLYRLYSSFMYLIGLGGVYIKHLMSDGDMLPPSRTAGGHMLLKDAVLDLRKGRRYGVAAWLHRRCSIQLFGFHIQHHPTRS